MPILSINIPAGEGVRVMNALCDNAGLPPSLANAQQAVREFIVRTVSKVERNNAILAVVEPIPVNPT